MGRSKVMSLEEAVGRFVSDGDTVYAGYLCVPFALTHEIIRQRKRGLEVVGASAVFPASELILAGCCSRVRTGYLQAAMQSPQVAEMMARGELEYEDYSNQAIAMMLMAGALGIPFIPTRSFLGTGYLAAENQTHPGSIPDHMKWAEMESPFDAQKVVLLPAIRPDVAIMHEQRADADGNVQTWGHQGDARWGLAASRKVIVTVEELVPSEVVRSDPNRTIIPGMRVSAVVHCPFGAHPSGLAGYYDFDYLFLGAVLSPALVSREGFAGFRSEWIDSLPNQAAYMRQVRATVGEEAFAKIVASPPLCPREAVDYAYSHTLNLATRQGRSL